MLQGNEAEGADTRGHKTKRIFKREAENDGRT